jgi:ABC-type glycerol-3-phosphate transport system permease component
MLWGFFQNLPRELEEAAQLDGLTRLGALFRVVFPLAAPGIAAVMLFTFVVAWEEYLMSLMVMSTDDKITLTVGAARLVGGQAILWGELMAYSTMMTLPVAVVFAVAQRYLVAGMTAGAVK